MARVFETHSDGSITKEELQFMNDRVTHMVDVGSSESEAQTAEAVISAMTVAVRNFQLELPDILGKAEQ